MNEKKINNLRKSKLPLRRHDWDFEDCPEDELYPCMFYEYARDAEFWLKFGNANRVIIDQPGAVAAEFEKLSEMWKRNWTEFVYQLAFHSGTLFIRLFPEFPQLAWLDIPRKVRRHRLQQFTSITHVKSLPIRVAEEDKNILLSSESGMVDYAWQHITGIPQIMTRVLLEISWGHTDAEIIKCFKDTILTLRPKATGHKAKRGGGRSECRCDVLRAKLKEIAAMRLLRFFTPELAAEYTQKQSQFPLYTTPRSWRRARNHASYRLTQFDEEGFPVEDTLSQDPFCLLLGKHPNSVAKRSLAREFDRSQ